MTKLPKGLSEEDKQFLHSVYTDEELALYQKRMGLFGPVDDVAIWKIHIDKRRKGLYN